MFSEISQVHTEDETDDENIDESYDDILDTDISEMDQMVYLSLIHISEPTRRA